MLKAITAYAKDADFGIEDVQFDLQKKSYSDSELTAYRVSAPIINEKIQPFIYGCQVSTITQWP